MKKTVILGTLLLSALLYGKDYSQYKTDKLLSPEAAKEMIQNNKNVVLIDVRPSAKFLLSNIEGSYNFWRPDMEPKDGRYGEIGGMRASREELEAELNKMGVTKDSTVILTGDGVDEYRLWWILDLYGMENVKVIDGGYDNLKATGIDTRMGSEADEKAGNYKFPAVADKDTLATIETVKLATTNPEYKIIDTRSDSEFEGKSLKKGAFVKGRIPESIHIEWTETLDKDKTFKSYDELVKLYAKDGITPDKIALPYCQSAVRSAHTTFVLKELLGYPTVQNYDGSWIEWSHEARDGKVKVEAGDN